MKNILTSVALFLTVMPAQADAVRIGTNAYRHGEYGSAAAILKPLAQEGDPIAQFAIGVMHDDGHGLPQDFTLALAWYKRAAEAGLVDAQYMVGRFYGSGRGVKQNPATAFFWFNIAAAGGHPHAGRLRDQHRHQISVVQRRHIEEQAVAWHRLHPWQFTCKRQRCIFASWTELPRWNLFDAEDLRAR